MKTIAIEEHFITPMYRQKVAANEFRNFYLTSRSEQIGHDIVEQNSDLGAKRLAHMDAAGIDVQVLSFGSPGPQGFGADVAIPMAKDANDLAREAVEAHPDRFAAFAALPTADPGAAAEELERRVNWLGFKGAMIHGHTRGSFLDEKKYWVMFERAQALGVPLYLHPTLPHPDALKAYFHGYEDLARAGWGFAVDTSCHFLRIVFAGVCDAYPRMTIILGHLGEGFPFALHRNDLHPRVGVEHPGEDDAQEMAARIHRETPARARELLVPLEVGLERVRVRERGMEVERHAERLGALENHPVFLLVEETPSSVAVDHRAFEPQPRDAALELLGRGAGVSRRQRGECGETVRVRLDRLAREIVRVLRHRDRDVRAEALKIGRAEGEHLHVDAG